MERMAEWQWKRWDAVARLGAGKLTLQEAARVLRLSVRQVRFPNWYIHPQRERCSNDRFDPARWWRWSGAQVLYSLGWYERWAPALGCDGLTLGPRGLEVSDVEVLRGDRHRVLDHGPEVAVVGPGENRFER